MRRVSHPYGAHLFFPWDIDPVAAEIPGVLVFRIVVPDHPREQLDSAHDQDIWLVRTDDLYPGFRTVLSWNSH